jgi:hypothetical protein
MFHLESLQQTGQSFEGNWQKKLNMANICFFFKKELSTKLSMMTFAYGFTCYLFYGTHQVLYTACKRAQIKWKIGSAFRTCFTARKQHSCTFQHVYTNSGEKRRVIYSFCKICNISTQVQSPEFWVTVHSNI